MSDRLHSVFLHSVLFTEFLEPNISGVCKQLGTIGLNDFKYAKETLASKKVGTVFLPHFYVWMITRRFGGKEKWYLKCKTIRRRNFLTCCKGFVRLLIYLTKSLFELTANCQESKQFICYELPSESVTNFTKTTFISKHDSNHLQSLLTTCAFQKVKVFISTGEFFQS